MSRIYTRGGDEGKTSLAGGQRLRKDAPRIDCYGTVDELNACIGLARESAAGMEPLAGILLRIQHELFNLGASLATLPEDAKPGRPCVTAADVEQLERDIDALSAALPPLNSFVLPGGSRLNAELHLCRTVCRRAERLAVTLEAADAIRYLNRLSDALFIFARWANFQLNLPETPWPIR